MTGKPCDFTGVSKDGAAAVLNEGSAGFLVAPAKPPPAAAAAATLATLTGVNAKLLLGGCAVCVVAPAAGA